ncbi:MAG: hypothetical protein ABSD88_18640 [Candidatus Korobacteraceae bacterium]|jgi:hypothetical protein
MASPLSDQNLPPVDAGHVPMTEEFGGFKRNMPAPGPLIVAMLLVGLAVGAGIYFLRYEPVASGAMGPAFAVDLPDHSTVLVTVQISVKNISKKPIFLKNVRVTVRTNRGEFSDDFAPVSDFERYFQAYPELRQHSTEGLKRDTRIAPGEQASGTVIVSFPLSKDAFDARQATTATVSFYDQKPIVIK